MELKNIQLLDITNDISDLSKHEADRFIFTKIEPETTLQQAVTASVVYWAGDQSLPGATEKQIRGYITDILKHKFNKDLNKKPFEIDGYLVFGLICE